MGVTVIKRGNSRQSMKITYEEYEGILSYEDKVKLGDLGNLGVVQMFVTLLW